MDKVLQDRIAIVTGGAQGLGEAICRRLAREGAHVVIADLNLKGAERVATEIMAQTDRRAIAVQADVTNEDQVAAMVDGAIEEFGRLDILVSNAGILIAEAVDEFPADKWQAVLNVNLFGYFLCAKHAARVMKTQRSGVIIQINSKSGKKGSYKNSAYAASKFGSIGLTQSIALELAEYNVKWDITEEQVRQKYIDQVPMRRGCTYDDVCNVVVFLASEQASYMTGQAINVTGGQEMR
jgi:sorbitol-6-phosphate 2-dehydrogenase